MQQWMTHEEETAARIRRALAALAHGADDPATPDEAAANVASIAAVPLDVLPPGRARAMLLEAAQRGADVYAYQAASLRRDGPWNVWVVRERITAAEWAARFAEEE